MAQLHTNWSSKSELEKSFVRNQLERVLEHSSFKNSKRCPALLRYIVEHTLSGEQGNGHLKERTLGIEVFGRPPEYDTNSDPIVRATASEIRKRLAQYYHEPGHENEIAIELAPGSYVPEFKAPESVASTAARWTRTPLRLLGQAGVACLALAAISVGLWKVAAQPTPLNEFWSPLVESSSPSVLIGVSAGWCGQPGAAGAPTDSLPIPPRPGIAPPAATQQSPRPCSGIQRMAYHDAIAMAKVAGVLQSKGKEFEIRPAASIDYTELQKQPVVFIGLGSGWAVHIVSQMRYRFNYDTGRNLTEIVDSKAPNENYWGIPIFWQDLPPDQLTRDYGLISRLTDPATKQTVVTVAGAGAPGTIAAANFLSDPKYMRDVLAKAPKDWSKKNLQVVIETNVINGRSGPPSYVASQFW